MSECRNRLKKADQFNEQMQINIEIKELEKQIDLAKRWVCREANYKTTVH